MLQAEIERHDFYRWPLTPDERKSVDRERSSLGGIPYNWYVILLLCDWLGISPLDKSQFLSDERSSSSTGDG
jgi:hypothetical protein